MTTKKPAILHRKDPRVKEDGIKVFVLKPEDAQIELIDFKIDSLFEITELTATASELLSHENKSIQPLDFEDLNYEFLQTQGFLYPIHDIRIKDKSKRLIESGVFIFGSVEGKAIGME